MVVKKLLDTEPERLLASLSPETIDRLADLVVTKLRVLGSHPLTSKQVVAGPSPVSRSTGVTGGLASPTNPGNLPEYLSRYRIAARAAGLSQATVNHVSLCVTLFSRYLGEAASVQKVRAEDYRSFLVSLQERRAWEGTPFVKPRPLSPGTINTYARGIHSFWSWLKREGLIRKNPLATVPAPRLPHRLPRAFSEEEVKKILRVAKSRPRDLAMVQLFLDSGIRLGELLMTIYCSLS